MTKTAVALVAGLLAAAALAVRGAEPYRCECCKAYFGKTPESPSFFGKGFGYPRLLRSRKYDEILQRFDEAYRRGEYSLDDLGWVGEAAYALAALKSERPDPLQPVMLFRDGKPEDIIANDVWWMHEKYLKKIWDKPAIEQYGNLALCVNAELRKLNPNYPLDFKRYLTLLISTGQFDAVLREVRALKKDSLSLDMPPGEFLARITEQYVGSALYEQGAAYLSAVKKTHGLQKDTRDYWIKVLSRAVQDDSLAPAQKKRLQEKIRAI